MADVADIANEIAQERVMRILENRPKTTAKPSALKCEECGDIIPDARRLALPGVATCIHCQTLNEDSARWRH